MTDWTDLYSRRIESVRSMALRDMLSLTQEADIICMAGGLSAPEMFPLERFQRAADLVLSAHGQQALQYSPTEGYLPLRQLVSSFLGRYGIQVYECNVLITTGSQQATELIGRLFLDPKDGVVVESPTYFGALQSFDVYRPNYLLARNDDDGLVVDELEPLLETGPKFLYLLPNFQNPGGASLSLERRKKLVAMAAEWGVAIVEDDPYSQLRYEGEEAPPLIALDHQLVSTNGAGYTGSVLYHSTFSKLLAPGLRIGWVIAPVQIIQKLTALKQGIDLHTSTLTQMVAYEVARDGFLEEHVQHLRKVYHHRRDVMLQAMESHFPAEVTWTHPRGGLFLFVTLPKGIDARAVLGEALKKNVAFVPGKSFFPHGGGENTFRLNFSYPKPDRIVEGIKRLGSILKGFCTHIEE